jgi:Ca-activated chloride channel homolog
MIVYDASSSMGVRTTRITRHEAGRRAMARIVPPVSSMRPLGLLVYSGGATRCDDIRLKVAPVIGSGPDILSALAEVNPAGATPLGHAIEAAAAYFHDRAEVATLVVVTDGLENCGADLCRLANQLAHTVPSIEIQLIGYGLLTSEGEAMRCLADQNGGTYTPVGTPDQLIEALEQSLACPAVSGLDRSRAE